VTAARGKACSLFAAFVDEGFEHLVKRFRLFAVTEVACLINDVHF
jgi:hypothetical protein